MKERNIMVSIIIPCFNAEKTIERAIGSIYIQDYEKIELIIVDDGSNDSSANIIKGWYDRFAENGMLLKYIHQENAGVGAATNSALKYVTGKYLTLLDADDQFMQGSIRKRVTFLEDNPEYVGVKSNGWIVRKDKKQLFVQREEEKNISDLFMALVEGRTNNWSGSYMIRTDILFEFYPSREIYPSRYGQNLQLIMPVAYKKKFGYLDEPLMEYIIQENSITQTQTNKYEKDENNSQGYKDIYTHVILQVVKDEYERKKYLEIIDACFCRSAMIRAISYNDKEKAKKNFKELKSIKKCTLNDRIIFYRFYCPIIALVLRCLRKGLFYKDVWRKRNEKID